MSVNEISRTYTLALASSFSNFSFYSRGKHVKRNIHHEYKLKDKFSKFQFWAIFTEVQMESREKKKLYSARKLFQTNTDSAFVIWAEITEKVRGYSRLERILSFPSPKKVLFHSIKMFNFSLSSVFEVKELRFSILNILAMLSVRWLQAQNLSFFLLII